MMSSYKKLCSGRQLREKHRQKRNEMLKSVIIVPFPQHTKTKVIIKFLQSPVFSLVHSQEKYHQTQYMKKTEMLSNKNGLNDNRVFISWTSCKFPNMIFFDE